MTTTELLEIVKRRGMRVELQEGRPVLVTNGARAQATEKLLAVLRIHRERVIAILQRQPSPKTSGAVSDGGSDGH